MKTLITFAAVLAFCAAPQLSYAEPPDANAPTEDAVITGLLDRVDVIGATVTLAGYTYTVTGSVANLETFAAGEQVSLGYMINIEGDRQVTSLQKDGGG